jgi:hypothetical protein
VSPRRFKASQAAGFLDHHFFVPICNGLRLKAAVLAIALGSLLEITATDLGRVL